MKSVRVGLAIVGTIVLAASQSFAGEWQIVGPRALGMGGANVAVADDATASYWNPGAFGFFNNPEAGGDYGNRGWSSQVGAGVGAQTHEDLVQEVDKISKFDFDALDNGPLSANQVSDFIGLVDQLKVFSDNENRAVSIFVDGGLRSQFGHFGFGVTSLVDVSAKGDIDLNNIAPVGSGAGFSISDFSNPDNFGCPSPCNSSSAFSDVQRTNIREHLDTLNNWSDTDKTNYINAMDNGFVNAGETPTTQDVERINNVASTADVAAGAGGELSNNNSSLLFKGIGLVEVPLTYGHALSEDLSIGGNLKFMKARVYDLSIPVFGKDDDFGEKLDRALDNYSDKTNVGLDLGGLYRFGDDLRVGLVIRNLNSPKFGSIKQRAQVRTGVAYKPLSFVTLAADLDLTKNETTIGGGFKSQNIAAGLELRLLKILMLRGGLYRNLAKNDIGMVYTAGLGLNLWLINLDVGVALSKDKTDFDGDSIPEEARGTLALSMLF